MNKDNDTNNTYVGKHAMDRLQKVEEDRKRVYKKKPHHFNFNKVIMIVIFGLILVLILYSMLK